MPKPLSGSILTRRLVDDTLVVDVKIRTERRMLGPASEWSETRARKLSSTSCCRPRSCGRIGLR